MALELPTQPLDYADYAAIDDGRRYQLVEGELIVSPSPSSRHQSVLSELHRIIANYVHETKRGKVFFAPLDVVLRADRPGTVLQPDLFYISPEHLERITTANVQGAPDLVVEILSPSNARLDTVRKLALYESHGVKEYWIVLHEIDHIEVVRLGEDGRFGRPTLYVPGDKLETSVLPGLSLDIAELFHGLEEEFAAEL